MLAPFNRAVWEFYPQKSGPFSLQTVITLPTCRKFPVKGVNKRLFSRLPRPLLITRAPWGLIFSAKRSLTSAVLPRACEADGNRRRKALLNPACACAALAVPKCLSSILVCGSKTRRQSLPPIQMLLNLTCHARRDFVPSTSKAKWTVSRQSMYVQLLRSGVGRPIFNRIGCNKTWRKAVQNDTQDSRTWASNGKTLLGTCGTRNIELLCFECNCTVSFPRFADGFQV